MVRHVVWDWNGTLLADQQVVLHALNALMAEFGLPATDMATYQRLYTRPVRLFYERLFQRPVTDRDWHRIEVLYHDAYHDALEAASLDHHAHDALDAVHSAGRSQSLLSMARHEHLVPLVEQYGIHERFVRVDGLRGVGGGKKAPFLEDHIRAVAHIAGDDPGRILVIGDATDDAIAAEHVGARCVLYDGGSHPIEELERTGAQVAATLLDALDIAGID